jgi:hypothetical protein
MKTTFIVAYVSSILFILTLVFLIVFAIVFPQTHPWKTYEFVQTSHPLVLNTIDNTLLVVYENTTALNIPGIKPCSAFDKSICFTVFVVYQKVYTNNTFAVHKLNCGGTNNNHIQEAAVRILKSCLSSVYFNANEDIPPEYRELCPECLGPRHTIHKSYNAVIIDADDSFHAIWVTVIVLLCVLAIASLTTAIINWYWILSSQRACEYHQKYCPFACFMCVITNNTNITSGSQRHYGEESQLVIK